VLVFGVSRSSDGLYSVSTRNEMVWFKKEKSIINSLIVLTLLQEGGVSSQYRCA